MLERVLLAGGGTGGHLYPGLAVAESLRQAGVSCRFVGTIRGLEAKVVPERNFPLHLIRARGLAGKPWQKLLAAVTSCVGVLDALQVFLRHRPQLVISTGGYVCGPVLLASVLTRVPVLMLEQNALPGKVNRKLARFATRICISFEESRSFFPAELCVLTGNPVRQEILVASGEEGREFFKIPKDRPVLLVTGASQGAQSLNQAVLKALPLWRDRPWTILHLTGPKHFDLVQQASAPLLNDSQLDYRPFSYMKEMHLALACSNLVVGRAGATSLAEITARGLPSILVPYPWAADKHQDYNAQALSQRGAAVVIDDSAVEELLAGQVLELMEDSQALRKMAEASFRLGKPKALEEIVELSLNKAGAQVA